MSPCERAGPGLSHGDIINYLYYSMRKWLYVYRPPFCDYIMPSRLTPLQHLKNVYPVMREAYLPGVPYGYRMNNQAKFNVELVILRVPETE